MKKEMMKMNGRRVFLATLLMIAILSLIACAKDDTGEATDAPTATGTENNTASPEDSETSPAVTPTAAASATETPVPTETASPTPAERPEISLDNLELTTFTIDLYKNVNDEKIPSVHNGLEIKLKTPSSMNCTMNDKWKYYDGDKIQQLQITISAEFDDDKEKVMDSVNRLQPDSILLNENGYFIFKYDSSANEYHIFTPASNSEVLIVKCNIIRGSDRNYTKKFTEGYLPLFVESLLSNFRK